MPQTPTTIVWFKRDLRLHDHAPLQAAAQRGRVIPLFIAEPSVWSAPDLDAMHWSFVSEALDDLRAELAALGQPLVVRTGEAVEVLEALRRAHAVDAVYAHEETGTRITFDRDLAVARWARSRGVEWCEWPTNGVVRRLASRDGWSRHWTRRMQAEQVDAPLGLPPIDDLEPGTMPDAAALGVSATHPAVAQREQRQIATRDAAEATLESFLEGRGSDYARSLSAPVSAARACSRVSPYLAWGLLSLREVVQATESSELSARSRGAFLSRLHWRCHFVQKLESEPAIEHQCFNPTYESLRGEPDPDKLAAWCEARTGFPFVDACIRSLQETGWINFRMRAMLVSFAAYDLWLDWRSIRDFLACQFVDYEPGIHISQLQMQSGTTGINTPRMYNPIKQGYDHDPQGAFVRRWVPELAKVPDLFIHEPWRLSPIERRAIGLREGIDYPAPVVDHTEAIRHARARVAEVRRDPGHRSAAAKVFDRHGSRRKSADRSSDRQYRNRRVGGSDAARFNAPRASEDQLNLFD